MSTQDHLFGAALLRIVEDDLFTALNKGSRKRGHYLINNGIPTLVKYARTSANDEFHFTFTTADVELMNQQQEIHVVSSAARTPSLRSVPPISVGHRHDEAQPVVKVTAKPGKSLRILGPAGQYKHAIARNRFPRSVLGEVSLAR